MGHNRYIRYSVPTDFLKRVAQRKTRVVFFIDLLSISKGLYQKNNVFMEIKHYIEHRQPSDTLIQEYRSFLNKLYIDFKEFNPYFVTFYDDGQNAQNLTISSGYKAGRSSMGDILCDDQEYQAYVQIKQLYFIKIEQRFTKEHFGQVYYLKEYESDLIPYYCIINNLYKSGENDTLNIVFSCDKDLLQCCAFNNTVQLTNRFFPSKIGNKRLDIKVFDDRNAIEYIYDKFKQGQLTAKYIPLILAIAGDKADHIGGIKGVGPAKAISMIQNFNIGPDIWDLERDKDKLPSCIKENLGLVIRNMKMIDFKQQLKRTSILRR